MLLRTTLIVALTLAAESSSERHTTVPKPQPWEWTDEARIAARTDPAQIRERIAAYDARHDQERVTVGADAAQQQVHVADHIDGRDQPELFLPTEALGTFLLMAYGFGDDESGLEIRNRARLTATRIGLPADFMQEFERETADIARLQAEEVALREQFARDGEASPAAWQKIAFLVERQCPLRAAAIQRLRVHYGGAFDRFLYEEVVPHLSRNYRAASPTADELRRLAAGCQ